MEVGLHGKLQQSHQVDKKGLIPQQAGANVPGGFRTKDPQAGAGLLHAVQQQLGVQIEAACEGAFQRSLQGEDVHQVSKPLHAGLLFLGKGGSIRLKSQVKAQAGGILVGQGQAGKKQANAQQHAHRSAKDGRHRTHLAFDRH